MRTPAFNGAQYVDIKKTVKCVGARFFVGIDDFCSYLGNCSIKHSTLTGLDADDHPLYALKTDVSNNYSTIASVTALRTDVSNNYAPLAYVDLLRTDVSNNYVEQYVYDNLQSDVSNHFWRDTSNHALEVLVSAKALGSDVSNNYATNVEVSNLESAVAAEYMLQTDASNNYVNRGADFGNGLIPITLAPGAIVASTTILSNLVTASDVSNNYVTQSDVSNNYKFSEGLKFGNRNTDTGSGYMDVSELNSGVIGYKGYTMPASGSIRGLGMSWEMTVVTTPGNFTVEVWKSKLLGVDAVKLCETITSISGTGYHQTTALWDSGDYEFDPSDLISLYCRFESGLAGSWRYGIATVPIEYNI
jgi:hypothetical protein